MPDRQWPKFNGVNPKIFHCFAGARNVDYGIQSADLMKVNVINRD
jgi:hypothetical protein